MSSNSLSSSVEVRDQDTRVHATPVHIQRRSIQGFLQKSRIGGYSLAIIAVLVAFLLRLLVDPWLGDQSPYLLFVVAVAVAGLYAGVRPALLAAAMGTVIAYFCFVPPRYRWGFAGVSDAVGFGVYVLGVAGVILLTRARIRATEKGELHRMQAEEILLKTERLSAAGQMASLLAHEINNPLTALTNVMFLLNQQPYSSSSRELLTAATDALHRVNRIAGMTMGFFSEKDTPVPVSIHEIADAVIDTLASTERFKSIQCLREFRTDTAIVASPLKMKQLIANLLTNAMESGANTGRIRVSAGRDLRVRGHNGIRITIADDGCGIGHELRDKIFEPFFSLKQEKGTGLGLWACRAIVLRNDGSIRLRSAIAGPRKGTCFSVFLPIVSEVGALAINSANRTGNMRAIAVRASKRDS